jgi:hypothetical protein
MKTAVETSYSESKEASVVMPIGSPWTCMTMKVASRPDGAHIAGFVCYTSEGAMVQIGALCSPTKQGADSPSMVISGGPKFKDQPGIRFIATCGTACKPAE